MFSGLDSGWVIYNGMDLNFESFQHINNEKRTFRRILVTVSSVFDMVVIDIALKNVILVRNQDANE